MSGEAETLLEAARRYAMGQQAKVDQQKDLIRRLSGIRAIDHESEAGPGRHGTRVDPAAGPRGKAWGTRARPISIGGKHL